MQFFLDTCDIAQIAYFHEMGMVDGITTNPSLIAASGKKYEDVLSDICNIVKTSVSAEVISEEYLEMMKEAEKYLQVGKQITIKVPLTFDGLRACKTLTNEGHQVNTTLCFSTSQALLAAKAGATYVSPFIGRLDDIGQSGLQLIKDIVESFANYPQIFTQVLVASIRSPIQVVESAKLGADIVTMPPSILHQMVKHPLTDKGLEIFKKDWERAYAAKK